MGGGGRGGEWGEKGGGVRVFHGGCTILLVWIGRSWRLYLFICVAFYISTAIVNPLEL